MERLAWREPRVERIASCEPRTELTAAREPRAERLARHSTRAERADRRPRVRWMRAAGRERRAPPPGALAAARFTQPGGLPRTVLEE